MCMFTERTEVLLSPEQSRRLKAQARQEGRSVGAVIREAVDAYVKTPDVEEVRRAAIERLLALEAAPVDDWEIMKAQILAGSLGLRYGEEPESPE